MGGEAQLPARWFHKEGINDALCTRATGSQGEVATVRQEEGSILPSMSFTENICDKLETPPTRYRVSQCFRKRYWPGDIIGMTVFLEVGREVRLLCLSPVECPRGEEFSFAICEP